MGLQDDPPSLPPARLNACSTGALHAGTDSTLLAKALRDGKSEPCQILQHPLQSGSLCLDTVSAEHEDFLSQNFCAYF